MEKACRVMGFFFALCFEEEICLSLRGDWRLIYKLKQLKANNSVRIQDTHLLKLNG